MKKIFFKKSKKFIFLSKIFNICNYSEKSFHNQKIFGVNNIKDAKIGDVTFFNDLKYEYDVKTTKASACIVNKKFARYLNKNTVAIISQNPLLDFYKTVIIFYPYSDLSDCMCCNGICTHSTHTWTYCFCCWFLTWYRTTFNNVFGFAKNTK